MVYATNLPDVSLYLMFMRYDRALRPELYSTSCAQLLSFVAAQRLCLQLSYTRVTQAQIKRQATSLTLTRSSISWRLLSKLANTLLGSASQLTTRPSAKLVSTPCSILSIRPQSVTLSQVLFDTRISSPLQILLKHKPVAEVSSRSTLTPNIVQQTAV